MIEQRITDILTKYKVSPYNIESYLDDIFAFSDRELYESSTDKEIIEDFEYWVGK